MQRHDRGVRVGPRDKAQPRKRDRPQQRLSRPYSEAQLRAIEADWLNGGRTNVIGQLLERQSDQLCRVRIQNQR